MRNRSLSKGDDDGVSWQTAGNKCSLIGGSDSKAEQQEEQSVLRDVSSFTRVRSTPVIQLVLAAQIRRPSEWQISNFKKLLLKLVQRVFNWLWNNLIPKPLYEEVVESISIRFSLWVESWPVNKKQDEIFLQLILFSTVCFVALTVETLLSKDASKINRKSKLIAAALNSWDQLCPKSFFSYNFFKFGPQREMSSCCWLFVYSQPHRRRLLDVFIRKVVAESLQSSNFLLSCAAALYSLWVALLQLLSL